MAGIPCGMRSWEIFLTGGIAMLNPRLMAGIPCGMRSWEIFLTGGIAMLNPRLIAGIPAGSSDLDPGGIQEINLSDCRFQFFNPGGIQAISPELRSVSDDTRGQDCCQILHPGGMAASFEIFRVVFHAGLLEHRNQFFSKRFCAMVLLLMGDISLHCWSCRRAYSKGGVTFLPGKLRQFHFLMDPN